MKISHILTSNPIKGALFFAVVASVLGGFALSTVLTVPFMYLAIRDSNFLALAALALAFMGIPAFAPIFGAVPAAITGLIAGFFRARLATWYGVFVTGVLGVLVTLFTFTVFITPPGVESISDTFDKKWDSLLMFGMCGFFGGAGAAFLFGLRPNNSFKPNPLRGSA